MHTISTLRKALGLATANQVRNRIEAVRDVLEPYLRRGPNNQILLTDDGLAVLRQLQELYDSGLRMAEASDVLRHTADNKLRTPDDATCGFVSNQTTATATGGHADSARAAQDEIAFLRSRVVELEGRLASAATDDVAARPLWWTRLREDVDVP